jgi:hypothetical protein
MLLDGKLGRSREPICALGGLVYLQDANSKQNFLVDTGAAVSVFPHKSNSPSSGPPLAGADGKPIPSWGRVKKSLTFGFRTFLCSFILAAVSKPILGVDFLSANRLLVDSSTRQVLVSDSLRPLMPPPAEMPTRSRLAAALYHVAPAVRALISSFPAIIGDGSGTPAPKHGVRHSIETSGRPVFSKARRLDPEKHRIAEAEFGKLEKPESCAGQIHRGHCRCIWCQNPMGLGAHAAITAG